MTGGTCLPRAHAYVVATAAGLNVFLDFSLALNWNLYVVHTPVKWHKLLTVQYAALIIDVFYQR